MKNKKITIGLMTTSSFAILGLSAFALFTARDNSDFVAKAGTVNLDIDELTMTNPDNINPGDNDPNNPEDAIAGTEHIFEYNISNLGTKSIRTRQTIILTALDKSEQDKLLDARFLCLFENNKELETKTYILEDDSEITNLKNLKDTDVIKAVKYVFLSDVFDGHGKSIENGGNAEKENLKDVIKEDTETKNVEKIYSYDFALLRGASNIYQSANFKIDVVVEAMQYRNTDESDWEAISTVSRTFSTANIKDNYVPAQNEDKEGKELKSEFTTDLKEDIKTSETK